MVRDGYLLRSRSPLVAAALLVMAGRRPYGRCRSCLLAAFFLWFFRDPERVRFRTCRARSFRPGTARSPTSQALPQMEHAAPRISIFLNVFDVHVNRSPIARSNPRSALPTRESF